MMNLKEFDSDHFQDLNEQNSPGFHILTQTCLVLFSAAIPFAEDPSQLPPKDGGQGTHGQYQ